LDPVSGKNLFQIPDPGPGVKKAPDPGSGSATLLSSEMALLTTLSLPNQHAAHFFIFKDLNFSGKNYVVGHGNICLEK
jgi:hypothetical protein